MDFRLKTFVSVARHRSFTRAARELFITQPAVTRHIKELEAQAGTTLFDRSGGGIALTKAGEAMLFHAEKILDSYRRMQFDMNLLTGNFSGELRLGASSTIAQYVLPPCLARFSTRYPEIRLTLDTGNSRQMVQALFSRSIDLALVEGEARHAGIRYEPFMRDELVLVTGSRSAYAARETVTPQELTALPIVLRENGSGTLEVIERRLGERQIKLSSLNVIMQMGSTEGIKSFLASYDCVALLSVQAVTRELLSDTLTVIDIDGLSFEREFAFATLQGVPGTVAGDFMRFASETLPHTRKNNRK
ncbi:LysR family transcriptional regulator [Rikenella microfusus]|uniref:LysR family transcriptional regulator n=1 Tax=Rikenella microfusus TaxID=28139 RepID=UPI001E1A8755|nr:LysR family transcriptional regulator [Rikenella microfusus]HJE88837.1 LysR family transcriptional regulator [Rikenella microfusus]